VFVFNDTTSSIQAAAKSVVSNMNLVRALPFPRAVLPVSSVVVDTLSTFPSYIMLCFIGLIVHAPSWAWLAMAPMMVVQLFFNIGVGFFVARFTVHMRDFAQFLPFILRVWFYLSGVLYTLDGTKTIKDHPMLRHVLELNPPHIFISIARNSVMVGRWEPLHAWITAVEWAVGLCVVGFLYFWRAEEIYGRD
jgi:teichoic acid transport system permease protein